MSITFACKECGKSFSVADDMAGKKGRCNGCGAVIDIPNPLADGLGQLDLDSIVLTPVEPTGGPGATGARPPHPIPQSPAASSGDASQRPSRSDEVLGQYMSDSSWRQDDRHAESQMHVAKWLLIIVGGLSVLANGIALPFVLSTTEVRIRDLSDVLSQEGFLDEAEIERRWRRAVTIAYIIAFGSMAVGAAMIACGLLIDKYPINASLAALTIFLASIGVFAVLDPSSIFHLILIKIIVIVALAKAVQSAYNVRPK